MPDGRVNIAFRPSSTTPLWVWAPTWTRIDSEPSLVASYTIDRGRQYELDRTDVGRAVVEISDRDGLLDPTNSSGPYYQKIEPLTQIALGRQNPDDGLWYQRFRGFIEEYDYGFDPSQQVNRLTIQCVDILALLAAAEMDVGKFGIDPAASGQPQEFWDTVLFGEQTVKQRIEQILFNLYPPDGLPDEFSVIFTGNVDLWWANYSGDTVLSAIQEAADAEFPGVSNVYADSRGRVVVHGRLARFDPATVADGATPGAWDFHEWQVGDHAAVVAAGGECAQLREFAFNRGYSKIVNSASAVPQRVQPNGAPPNEEKLHQISGQLVQDTDSIDRYGVRSWSTENLLTKHGLIDDTDALTETRRFAEYYVQNFAEPRNRITACGLRSIRLGAAGGAYTWGLLSQVDIADIVNVTVASPGGGGFDHEPFYVEGIHEQVRPLNPDMDDVTMTLDLSPQAYFTNDPWGGPHADELARVVS